MDILMLYSLRIIFKPRLRPNSTSFTSLMKCIELHVYIYFTHWIRSVITDKGIENVNFDK